MINELLAAIPADAPIVWVDCYLTDYQDAVRPRSARRCARCSPTRGNATVVDWASVAQEDGVLTDNVHPSGFGRIEFARRVTDGVNAWIS